MNLKVHERLISKRRSAKRNGSWRLEGEPPPLFLLTLAGRRGTRRTRVSAPKQEILLRVHLEDDMNGRKGIDNSR